MKKFAIIVSVHVASNGIGKDNQLPWKIKEDMKFFKETTTTTTSSDAKNVVIMGRKTWESLPANFRPLPGRINVVLSRDENIRERLAFPDDVLVSNSLESALQLLANQEHEGKIKVEKVFIIGGEALYKEALQSPHCETVFLTEVHGDFSGFDTFFPTVPAHKYRLVARSAKKSGEGFSFYFTEYEAMDCDTPIVKVPQLRASENVEEMQYLNMIDDIMKNGVVRGDRTGTGTISKFGVQMRFSLRNNTLPLITTKKVFWRGVAEELLWFVNGSTNANLLRDKNIHIWDGNASRQFLDSRGLGHREEGDLGPVYGFQWRHFGAEYKDMHADYKGQGIDQLLDCIDKIKNAPEDRRIVMTAWNPADLHLMALPPCHMFCQFYVANGEVSCHMYQRSADMGLGVPFNIASYSLLTFMVAQACGLKPGDFVHSIGDAHVYLNHIDALKIQVQRNPKPFPKLFLNEEVKDIDGFQYSDFRVEGYNPDASIKMAMAV